MRFRPGSARVPAALICLLVGAAVLTADDQSRFIRHAEAIPMLEELADILPLELQALPTLGAEGPWAAWIAARDSSIRARLPQGDQDTIVNWLMFGTSFTSQPRAIFNSASLADAEAVRRTTEIIRARADDLMRALQSPGSDERRLFARRFLEGNGFSFATSQALNDTRDHLLLALQRMAVEQAGLTQELEAARQTGDTETELAIRSTLFRNRGLSLDTSLTVNYAIDLSLADLKKRGLLRPGTVRRIAIVGAGLDFADRDAGFDGYPPQTLQPFAVLDSLRRLQLSPAVGDAEVVVFDISPRVREHIARARSRSNSGEPYVVTLPLAKRTQWLPEFREYWRTFGAHIGIAGPASANSAVTQEADLRAIQIRSSVVQRVSAIDLNIVAQRMDMQQFDVVIATNVLNYYDAVEQEIAAGNIESMLRSGGLLLLNTALPEIEALPIELVGSLSAVYTRAQDGDQILWYQRIAGAK